MVIDISLTNLVANRIKELCAERNLTINKLASMSGLAFSTINSIIRGTLKSPTLATLVRISNALSMTIVEFLDIPDIVEFSFDNSDDDEDDDT